jgi:hypothetical protein
MTPDAGRSSASRFRCKSQYARPLPRGPIPPVACSLVRGQSKAERGENLVGRTCGTPRKRFVHMAVARRNVVPPAIARLILVSPDGPTRVYALDKDRLTLGRGEENDIVVNSPFVSRCHAEFRRDPTGVYSVRDMHSRNGTTVNGQRLFHATPLHSGDVITICGLSFTYQTSDDTVALSSRPPAGAVAVDPARAEAWVDGTRVELSALEFRLLTLLESRAGTIVCKDDIAAHLWPRHPEDVSDERIEQLISRVRRKLGENSIRPRHLTTVRGIGYRLEKD